MEGESWVIRNIIDKLLFSGIQRDQMEGESGVNRSKYIDELFFSYIQEVQMERESGVTRSIIDELHSSEIL